MSTSLVGLLISVVLATLVTGPLAKQLHRHPGPFYAVAIILTGVYAWAVLTGQNLAGVRGLCMVLQKAYLSSILFGVVMFTGCFGEGTKIRKHLQPIRGELSILSFIFVLGHLCMYLPSYIARFGAIMSVRANMATSLVIALVLTALFALLAVTSLRALHRRMNPRAWKAVQSLAYLMVVLFILHVGMALGFSAFSGKTVASTWSFLAYVAVVGVYAVMRTAKAVRDAHRRGRGVGAAAS
jgi:sulfoxide reductase heme-binding subunit YedZ